MSLMHVELWVGSVWNYKYVYIFIIKYIFIVLNVAHLKFSKDAGDANLYALVGLGINTRISSLMPKSCLT